MIKTLLEYIDEAEYSKPIKSGDNIVIEFAEDEGLATYVVEEWDDCIIIGSDAITLEYLQELGVLGTALEEAEYQGRKVPLGKPMSGDVKKSKVYVKKPNGNIVKVNFGDKKLSIKKHIPKRRKSFRARHNCANPGPRWKARYWSCRAW